MDGSCLVVVSCLVFADGHSRPADDAGKVVRVLSYSFMLVLCMKKQVDDGRRWKKVTLVDRNMNEVKVFCWWYNFVKERLIIVIIGRRKRFLGGNNQVKKGRRRAS